MSSLSSEKQRPSDPRSDNNRKERRAAAPCSTLAWNDINQYLLGKRTTIDRFLEEGSRVVNSDDLQLLSLHAYDLLKKLEGISPFHCPGLDMAVHTIVLVLKSPRAKAAVDPLPKHLLRWHSLPSTFSEFLTLIWITRERSALRLLMPC